MSMQLLVLLTACPPGPDPLIILILRSGALTFTNMREACNLATALFTDSLKNKDETGEIKAVCIERKFSIRFLIK